MNRWIWRISFSHAKAGSDNLSVGERDEKCLECFGCGNKLY